MSTAQLPKRSKRFGVGKEIGGAVYVHKSCIAALPEDVLKAANLLPQDFSFTVIKYSIADSRVSFIQCDDFDTAHEPSVGESVSVDPEGNVKRRKPPEDPWIYHHKWLFVSDTYTGFDVEASRNRSRQWLALDNIDFRRIGRKSVWEDDVLSRLSDGLVDE